MDAVLFVGRRQGNELPFSAMVGIGPLKRWSPYDPRLPMPSDDDPPADWKAFRRWVAAQPGGVIKLVYPQYEGNRNQARREMGETAHQR